MVIMLGAAMKCSDYFPPIAQTHINYATNLFSSLVTAKIQGKGQESMTTFIKKS